jgi:hypothetical protein
MSNLDLEDRLQNLPDRDFQLLESTIKENEGNLKDKAFLLEFLAVLTADLDARLARSDADNDDISKPELP